jgi:hypothetical protein
MYSLVFLMCVRISKTYQFIALVALVALVASFIEFDSILSHPFDEIFNQHVLMKTVDQ